MLDSYKTKLLTMKEETMLKVAPIAKDLSIYNDYINSEKVSFIISQTKAKNNPINILSEFDALKNSFSPIDKSQIRCYDITITDNNLTASCSAYSTAWEPSIP